MNSNDNHKLRENIKRKKFRNTIVNSISNIAVDLMFLMHNCWIQFLIILFYIETFEISFSVFATTKNYPEILNQISISSLILTFLISIRLLLVSIKFFEVTYLTPFLRNETLNQITNMIISSFFIIVESFLFTLMIIDLIYFHNTAYSVRLIGFNLIPLMHHLLSLNFSPIKSAFNLHNDEITHIVQLFLFLCVLEIIHYATIYYLQKHKKIVKSKRIFLRSVTYFYFASLFVTVISSYYSVTFEFFAIFYANP